MNFIIGTSLLATATALACALPGVFVVLRRNSMLVDAISHAVLPGIIVGYMLTHSLESPLLIVGAALAGLVVVLGSEWLSHTGLLTGDAPQGLVFPALFSAGIILLTGNFANIHLDTHAVLVGDLNLAAWNQVRIGHYEYGPVYLYAMLGILALNALFIRGFYQKLTLTTFDSAFARGLGIRVRTLNTAFMFLVSLTITAAFHAVGAILVVALVVVPAATGTLLSRTLPALIGYTLAFAAVGSLAGFWLAYITGAATSAGMAVFYGLMFLTVWVMTRARKTTRARTSLTPQPA